MSISMPNNNKKALFLASLFIVPITIYLVFISLEKKDDQNVSAVAPPEEVVFQASEVIAAEPQKMTGHSVSN